MAYDIPSISDLEAIQLLNKHYAEVITSKEGGVSSAADITQTTNPITGVVRRTLYKILDDMDDTFLERLLKMAFTPVGTFTAGATLTDARQTLLWEVSQGGDGHYYSWSGSFGTSGKVVAAGSTPSPTEAGSWVDRTDDSLRDEIRETVFQIMKRSYAEAGYNLVEGSFQLGGSLSGWPDVLWDWPTGKGYQWHLDAAKTVAAGSVPTNIGTEWIDKSGDLLRSQLESGGLSINQLANPDAENINYADLISKTFVLKDRLDSQIWVSNRAELLAAQTFIKNTLGRRYEIHLDPRGSWTWSDAQTDIDLGYVILVGHGTRIDASGIANDSVNYFMRFYNSGNLNVGNIPYLAGHHAVDGILITGPGRATSVKGFWFHSPEGSLGSLTFGANLVSEFGYDHAYGQNAYIITHYGAVCIRSNNHVYMGSGYANYGENISYHGGTISTSGGRAVYNGNANGEINLFGVSVDYTADGLFAAAGQINCIECHIEINNTSNPFTGRIAQTGSGESACIKIHGGIILANIDLALDYLFNSDAASSGIHLKDVRCQNLLTTTYRWCTGTGPFSMKGTKYILGGSNFDCPAIASDAMNMLIDGGFESGLTDAFISADTATITSRTAGTNVSIARSTEAAYAGTYSLKITKTTSSANGAVSFLVPIDKAEQFMYEMQIQRASGSSGTLSVYCYWCRASGEEGANPTITNKLQFGPTRSFNIGTISGWNVARQQLLRQPAPNWATHMLVTVDGYSMSGSFYIDGVVISRI